jgi:multiple sugar transport system permease protein/multiple sugar transport system substrate-binding protein
VERLLRVSAIIAGLVFCLVAGASGRAPEPVTLHYWGVFWTFRDVLDDFENLHDGSDGGPVIRVVAAQSAEADMSGDSQRLLCAIAGGDPPDVVVFARHAVGELAERGAFECLQPLVDRDLRERPDDPFTVRREDYWQPCWDEASHEGQLYALPTDTDNRALYYNVDLLEKHAEALVAAGCVDPGDPSKPGPPRTWKQLRAAAEIMTEYDAERRLVRVGFIPNYGNSWLYLYGWLNGGRFLGDDGRTCTMDSPEIVDALAYMTEMYEAMGGAQGVYAFQSSMQEGDLDPFLAGKVAMKVDGNWFLPHIANNRRDMRFGVTLAPAPEGRERFGWCGGWSYAVPKGCQHTDEAWELMKYLMSPRAAAIKLAASRQMAQAGGQVFIPSINARRDVALAEMDACVFDNPGLEPKFKDAVRVFMDSLPGSKFRPATPVGQLLWNEHVRAMEAGIYMSYDSADVRRNAQMALSHSASVVQRELDRIYGPAKGGVIRWGPIVAGYAVLLAAAFAFMVMYFGRKMQAGGYFRREFYAGYGFASPWFLGFVLFGGGPILFSLIMSLCEYDVLTPPRFVGFSNYTVMLTKDPLFYKSLGNTCFMALGLPLGMAVGLGIAMLLSYEIRGMAVYRTFFYLPAIMPAVAASILWIWVFNPEQGILNALLAKVGIDGPPWLQSHVWAKPALILMGLWGAGGGMIIWLAGLKAIPAQLYEAAELDGAGALRRFWHVTMPMLTPYIFFNLIMGLIGTFQIFTQAYIMTQGGPVDSTLFYAYALFNNAFRYLRMGYASAMAWVLFAIVLALTALQLRLAKLWVHYEHER